MKSSLSYRVVSSTIFQLSNTYAGCRFHSSYLTKNFQIGTTCIERQPFVSIRNYTMSEAQKEHIGKKREKLLQREMEANQASRQRVGDAVKEGDEKIYKIFGQPLPKSSLVFNKNLRRSLEQTEFIIPSVSELMEVDESLQSPDYFQVFKLFTVKDLFEARVHFGHKIGSLDPQMRPFIFGTRFDQVIFDLDLTAFHLRQALNFVAHVAYRSGVIMFITRSPQTLYLVEKTAIECGEYAHTRTWDTTILADSRNKFGGITRLPDLIIMLNTLDSVLATHGVVKDAAKMLIPTVGIVDSNCNPNLVTYPIPGNDDSLSSVELYCKLFKEAILRGKNKRKVNELKQSSSS